MIIGYKNNPDGVKYCGKKFTYVDRPVHKLIIIQAVDEHINDRSEDT